jgi:hypothetical protein
MRIIKSNSPAGGKGNKSPHRPDWFVKWLEDRGKWVQLQCGCIEDVHIPQCITLLTGKRIYILCPYEHGFQRIKKTLTLGQVLLARGMTLKEDTDTKGLLPPF